MYKYMISSAGLKYLPAHTEISFPLRPPQTQYCLFFCLMKFRLRFICPANFTQLQLTASHPDIILQDNVGIHFPLNNGHLLGIRRQQSSQNHDRSLYPRESTNHRQALAYSNTALHTSD